VEISGSHGSQYKDDCLLQWVEHLRGRTIVDVCSGRPSTVTYVEVKEQYNYSIRDKY
jgi:hypothetical protein